MTQRSKRALFGAIFLCAAIVAVYALFFTGSVAPAVPDGDFVSICGKVYKDLDCDGNIDPGEPGVSGVTVTLLEPDGTPAKDATGAPVPTLTTDVNGDYCFMPDAILLFPRPYHVKITVPSGYTASNAVPGPGSGGTKINNTTIKVESTTPGGVYKPNDFLICPPAPNPVKICGTIYNDSNESGAIDHGDGIKAGVVVQLTQPGPDGQYCTSDDVVIGTQTTDAAGKYCFDNLAPGTYGVDEVVPSTYNAVGAFPGTGSGGTALAPDCIKVVATTPGTTYAPNDFLIVKKKVAICGFVYTDLNNSGTINSGDGKLSNVTIQLKSAGPDGLYCTSDDVVLQTQTTDSNGKYCFQNLNVGTYTVHEVVPTGWTAVGAFPSGGGTMMSANCIKVAAITPGNIYQPNNFLVKQNKVSICGTVHTDLDNSGTINTGDGKLQSVTIKLVTPGSDGQYCTSDDVVIATQSTDANGKYCFQNVSPGTYGVHEIVPSGWTAVGAFPGSGSGGTMLAADCIKVAATTPGTTYQPNDFLLKQSAAGGKITITKDADKTTVKAGGKVTYTYVVTNSGSTTLTNITVTDDNGTPSFTGDDFVVATIPSLAPGVSMTFYVTTIPPYDMCVGSGSSMMNVGTLITQIAPNGDVRVIYRQSRNVNENVYGAPSLSSGWTNTHTFKHLINSDMAQFRFRNGAGTTVVDVKIDYCTAASTSVYPSGYGSLGYSGGDGANIKGGSYVIYYTTTLTTNLNQSPAYYGYTTNSPTPESSHPTWDYVDGYTIIVSGAAFGTNGFGGVTIPLVHNSPPKKGNDPISPTPCDTVVTNTAKATATSGSTTVSSTDKATVTVLK